MAINSKNSISQLISLLKLKETADCGKKLIFYVYYLCPFSEINKYS